MKQWAHGNCLHPHRPGHLLAPGDRIVNVAGFHCTVVENNGETLQVELAPNVVATMETAGVMKRVDPQGSTQADVPTDTE